MISRLRALTGDISALRNEGAYFVIFNVTNALDYAYLFCVGFFLSRESYGLFGALFGLVYLSSSLGNMVRVAVARHVAAGLGSSSVTSRSMVISSLRWPAAVAAGVGLAFAAASPFIRSGFDSGTSPVAWTVLVVALSVWVPAGYGVLQGEQRFTALGTTLTTGALARLVGGLVLVLLGFGVAGAMAGLAFGYAASAVHVVALALSGGGTRRPEAPPANELPMRPSARSLAVVLVASASTAATTSLDVALVRHLFSAADSGAYTTIAVLGRVVLFGTVAIPFIALPKVSSRAGRGEDPLPVLRWSLLLTAVIAAPLALVIATPIALGLPVLGPNLSGAHAALFWYLAAMVAFSLIITFVYYHLGTGDSFYLLTIAAPAIILQTLLILVVAGSLAEVAQIICAVDVVALMASMIVTFRPRALWRPRLAPHAEPLPEGGFNR